ncbi:four-carbon acid sugar kinase family protein [Enterococcus sp. AZ103]|uniref:four-carbon acid sugar kinase family protein n=1 Tax=Enterococcus sp. AZ103 TaxID=2774628 RepID=UPI003F271C40
MNKKYLIIADDFTGANDTGVQLRKNNIETEVLLFPSKVSHENSIVLDTESRTIPAKEAYRKVRSMTEKILKKDNFDLVYKKIDSTLRGNISEELQAVIDVYQPDKVVFAPAFPKISRQTINGRHYLNGYPLMETEIANDPLNPIWTDNLVELVKKVTSNIKEYQLNELSSDLILTDSYIHIFNIETDQQLNILSKALKKQNEKILFVGSAGLAESLFTVEDQPVLSVVGSISEVSLQQMTVAETQGTKVVSLEINDLLQEDVNDRYTKKVLSLLETKQDVILTVTRKKTDYLETVKLFESLGITDKKEISNLIKARLASITKKTLENTNIAGIFLTGGDTAIEIIHQLGGNGCKIIEEVDTGVVKSRLVGGLWDGLQIVTKAGAFGQPETIQQSIENLKNKKV